MFTGIVTDVGEVIAREPRARRPASRSPSPAATTARPIALGASIACAGVCLTVVATGRTAADLFVVDAAAETLALTTAGAGMTGTGSISSAR